MISLRDRLRADTAPRHERVDRAYSSLDLTISDNLRTFLGAQLSVLSSVRCEAGPHAAMTTELRAGMAAALRADLETLSGGLTAPVAEHHLHSTSVLYILLGSSLGLKVLRRRWLAATDPAVTAAGCYLGLAPPVGAWRDLCEDLARRPSRGAEADRVVCDAGKIFDLHLAAMARHTCLIEEASHA